jgi:RHS repeat-associated protein
MFNLACLVGERIGFCVDVPSNPITPSSIPRNITDPWRPMGSGVVPAGTHNVTANFDPTLQLNGAYQFRVKAVTVSGDSGEDFGSAVVEGNMKIGNFKLSFNDLVVPVAGIPITVTRTYDTLDKRSGDFGTGWSLQMSNIRLQKSVPIHDFWQEKSEAFDFVNTTAYKFYFQQSKKHYITITFPSGEVYRFAATYSPQFQTFAPISPVRLDWVPVGRTRGSLRPTVEIGQSPTLSNVLAIPPNGGSFISPEWQRMFLQSYETGDVYEPTEFELTTLDGTIWIIDEKKGLVKVKEPNGNQLTFAPNGITSSTGAGVNFTRDGQGRITKITDPNGFVLNYTIDGNGDLVTFADREGKTNQFAYDGLHNMIRMLDAKGQQILNNQFSNTGRLTSTGDANGNNSTFTYGIDDPSIPDNIMLTINRVGDKTAQAFDSRGNITQTTRFLKLPNGQERQITTSNVYGDTNWPDKPTSLTDALGNTIQMTYDANGYLNSVIDAKGNVKTSVFDAAGRPLSVTDALGNTTTKTYDTKGNILTSTDAQGNVSTNVYDTQGRLTTVTDARGTSRNFTYDSFGRVIADTDPLGHTVHKAYDSAGRRLSESMTKTLANGSVVNLITSYQYDKEGRLLKTIRPNGTFTRSEYDVNGKVIKSYDVQGRVRTYEYDTRGFNFRTTHADGTQSVTQFDKEGRAFKTTSPRGLVTETLFDSLGRTVGMNHRDAANNAILDSMSTVYDDANRVIASTDARGNTNTTQYDVNSRVIQSKNALNQSTTYEYDAEGRTIKVTDALGRVSQTVYDSLGRVTSVITPTGTSTTTYDTIDRVIARTDPAGRTTGMTYDNMNRLVSVTDSGGHQTTYVYNEIGEKMSQTDAKGHTTYFNYDIMGRRVGRKLPMGQTSSTTYRLDGKMASTTDFNGHTTTYTYDEPTGRMLRKTGYNGNYVAFNYTTDGLLASKTRNGTLTTSYTYDIFGRTTQITNPVGVIGYTYDVAGNKASTILPSGTNTYTYDALNRLSTVTSAGGGVTTYTYNAVGNRQSKTLPNGVNTTYSYDVGNRLVGVNNSVGSSFTYVLDTSGKRLSVTDSILGTTNYTYDSLGRLTNETGSAGNISYAYDAVGNRTSKTTNGVTVSYAYNANDQMLSEGTKTFTYDANGNTITADGNTLTYDFEDRLISNTGTSGSTAYLYDANGNRIQKTVGTNTVTYLVDPMSGYGNVVEERQAGAGLLLARYDYGQDMISMTRSGVVRFYTFDGLGSTNTLTDASGNVTDRYGYDAYGNPTQLTGNSTNAFLFNGQEYDSETGLYYLRARYYAPGQGRFITHDPMIGGEGDPLSLHRYLYANADPVNNIDPTGMVNLRLIDTSVAQTEAATARQAVLAYSASTAVKAALTVGAVTVGSGAAVVATVAPTSVVGAHILAAGTVVTGTLLGIANSFTHAFQEPTDSEDKDDKIRLAFGRQDYYGEDGNYHKLLVPYAAARNALYYNQFRDFVGRIPGMDDAVTKHWSVGVKLAIQHADKIFLNKVRTRPHSYSHLVEPSYEAEENGGDPTGWEIYWIRSLGKASITKLDWWWPSTSSPPGIADATDPYPQDKL